MVNVNCKNNAVKKKETSAHSIFTTNFANEINESASSDGTTTGHSWIDNYINVCAENNSAHIAN